MAVKAKVDSAMAISDPPIPGSELSKASEVRVVPNSPDVQAPEAMIARPVVEHTMMMSMNVFSMAMRP